MTDREPSTILDEIASAQMSHDIQLMPGILRQLEHKQPAHPQPLVWVRFAVLLTAAVILVAFFAAPGMATALKNLVGFLPGVGQIDSSAPLRILAHAVTDQHSGFTLTIENVILDPSQTIILYKVEGQFPAWEDPALQPKMCRTQPILRLASGAELTSQGSEGGQGNGAADWKVIFPPLPASENQAVFVLPCLPDLPEGKGPQNWEILLQFAPAPPELTVYPVEPAAEQTTTAPAASELSDQALKLSIQGIAAVSEGFYLQAELAWAEEPGVLEMQVFPDALHVVDAAGQPVPAWLTDQIQVFAPASNHSLELNVQTGPIQASGSANLVLDYVVARLPASTSFTFETGENPIPGQTWAINQKLEIGGSELRVVSAEYIQNASGEPAMLMVYLQSDSEIISITALDSQHAILDSGGSPGSENIPFRVGWHYKDGFPQGTIQVEITSISVRRSGPWEAQWTPPVRSTDPAAPHQTAAIPEIQSACPSNAALLTASNNLTDGLGGKIAISMWDGEKFSAHITNLDGSDQISLGDGYFPHISPDGSKVVYMHEGGLYLYSLADKTGHLMTKVEENIFYNWPKWSPGGDQIGFERVDGHGSSVYVVNADGTNLRAVVDGPEDEHFLGWGVDDTELFYSIQLEGRLGIRKLNLQTKTSTDIRFLPPDSTGIQLSPDGKRIIYRTETGIFFVADSASSTIPINLPGMSNPFLAVFSPDNRWVAVSVWETPNAKNPGLVLLQPETCQMIWIKQQSGSLSAWK